MMGKKQFFFQKWKKELLLLSQYIILSMAISQMKTDICVCNDL